MKTKVFNIRIVALVTLLLTSITGFAQRDNKRGANTANDNFDGPSKTYSKSYPANANDKLKIENSFGKVIVNTWDKNEFKVDVIIKASVKNGNSQKLLDNINIADSKSGSTVSFKTNINDHNNSGGQKMAINYVVYMPAKSDLNISDEFGSIELPDMDGKVVVNSTFGSFSAKSLTNNADDIHASYSSVNIGSLKTAKLFVEFGSLKLGSADELTGMISYSTAVIDKLTTSGNFNLSYSGGFRIINLDKNFKKLSATAEYSGIKIGTGNDMNANFDITIENGSFSGGKATILSKTPPNDQRGWSPTKNYKGRVGQGDAGKVISINSSFGGVTFN